MILRVSWWWRNWREGNASIFKDIALCKSFKQYTSCIKLQDGESNKDAEMIMMHLVEKGLTINNYNFGEGKRSFFHQDTFIASQCCLFITFGDSKEGKKMALLFVMRYQVTRNQAKWQLSLFVTVKLFCSTDMFLEMHWEVRLGTE